MPGNGLTFLEMTQSLNCHLKVGGLFVFSSFELFSSVPIWHLSMPLRFKLKINFQNIHLVVIFKPWQRFKDVLEHVKLVMNTFNIN